MDKPNEIYIKKDSKHDEDLLKIINILLDRDYDTLLRREEDATIIDFDYSQSKDLGNSTFEYITPEEKEMLYTIRYDKDGKND